MGQRGGALHSGICSPASKADASLGHCGRGILFPACPAARGPDPEVPGRVPGASKSCKVYVETGVMAAPGPALCLFDVDGTLTAPRQVSGVRRPGGRRCKTPYGSPVGVMTVQVGDLGRLRTAYLPRRG